MRLPEAVTEGGRLPGPASRAARPDEMRKAPGAQKADTLSLALIG